MMMTTAVSINRMGPSPLGRRPVVAPGAAGRLRSCDMVELLTGGGIIRTHGLATLVGGRVAGGVDDGLGGQAGGDHTGGTVVVGHVGSWAGKCPSACALYALGWSEPESLVHRFMKSNVV